ncbi:hypothetical protein ACM66B_004528 [Microbotryomycetes sp. NB124-2]
MLAPRLSAHDFDPSNSLLAPLASLNCLARSRIDASNRINQRETFTLPVLDDAAIRVQDEVVNKMLAEGIGSLTAFDEVNAPSKAVEPSEASTGFQLSLWNTEDKRDIRVESSSNKADPFAQSSSLPVFTESEVLESALLSATGLESPLFAWDDSKDRLVWRSDMKGKQKEGARIQLCSDETSQHLVESVLTVGTAIVRLDQVVLSLVKPKSASDKLRTSARRDEKPSKSSHAVAASLFSCLAWTRQQLSTLTTTTTTLIDLSSKLSPIQSVLVALCNLFSRPASKAPPYHFLPLSTPSLLSHLHHFLQHHLDQSMTPPLLHQGVAAWLLDGALAEWQRGWYDWLGLTDRTGVDWSELGIEVKRTAKAGGNELTDDSTNSANDEVEYILHASQLPNFIPRAAASELFEAGRALRLLRRAASDHPLCQAGHVEGLDAGLAWTEFELRRRENAITDRVAELEMEIDAWLDRDKREAKPTTTLRLVERRPLPSFPQVFDQAPDDHSTWRGNGQATSLGSFLAARLDTSDKAALSILPLSTPLLSALLSRSLFSPLQTYSRLPSTCLLSLLFSDLSLATHFQVIRSFVFFGYEPFSRRVKEALFSAPEDKRIMRHGKAVDFAIGMGVYLHESSVWPPGGAHLGNALRTALKDALADLVQHRRDDKDEAARRVWHSLNSTLSFAYEQASEDDESKWKDPNSLEALDFLFVNYRVPSPLDLILTPSVMRKYHGVFKHLLRLLRVECIVRQIWQTVHKPFSGEGDKKTQLLLAQDPEARILLINLSFEVQNLVTSLCSYSFDCAVDNNFQSFMKALSKIESASMQSMRGQRSTSADDDSAEDDDSVDEPDDYDPGHQSWNLDSLSLVHQEFLSRVEKGLMLKRAQAPLKQLVEGILVIVMNLGRKVNSWRKGPEDDVVTELLSIRSKLRQVTSTLVKVLGALDDRGPISSTAKAGTVAADSILSDVEMQSSVDWVQQLLVRLDGPTRFYSSIVSKSGKKTAVPA